MEDCVSYTPPSEDEQPQQVAELEPKPPQGENAFLRKLLLTDLRPSYDEYLKANPSAAPQLHTLADILSHSNLSFVEICKKINSKLEEVMHEPKQLLYTTLLTYHLEHPDSDDLPAAFSLLACAPKQGNASYTSGLRKAAKHFLAHHPSTFVAALFTKRSILSGSLAWFCSTFPNLEHLLRPEIQRMIKHISGATAELETAISRLDGVELWQIPSAESTVAATRMMLKSTLGDLRSCLAVAEGADISVALSSVLYVLRAHRMFPRDGYDTIGSGEGAVVDEAIPTLTTPVVPSLMKRKLSQDDTSSERKRPCTPERGEGACEEQEHPLSSVEHRATEPAVPPAIGGGSPYRGGYKGRFYDPNYRTRGRGYRGSGGGYRGGRGAGSYYRGGRHP